MMRGALKRLDARRQDAVIIGDRMDTDILSGLEAEMETVLVFTGVTRPEELARFAYRPGYVLEGIHAIPPARPAE